MQRYPKYKSSVFSRLFGLFANLKFPSFLQIMINQSYVHLMKVDLKEFAPLSSYPSLNALFTRQLQKMRTFDETSSTFISPCDSLISAHGNIDQQTALQIKGHPYSIFELLGDYCLAHTKQKLEGGSYINFYLSPKDYHRYHAPISMRIAKAIHIPGKLYPVNFIWLRKIKGLFVENERVVLECYTEDAKLFYMVFVGALNVGKMCFTFDETIQTNAKASLQQCYMYDNLWMKKGQELGHFKMGSTIVMLFEKESFKTHVSHNAPICFGAPLGEALS